MRKKGRPKSKVKAKEEPVIVPVQPVVSMELTLKGAHRMLACKKSHDSLIPFMRLSMPSPEDVGDATKSRYEVMKHHEAIALALEEVERGNILRLIITLPPRAGKTELSSKKFVPWLLGRDPYRQIIFATYNETFAKDIGRAVRDTMQEPFFNQVFPKCELRDGGSASDRVQTKEGGMGVFVGAGGAITGRGADFLIIDDIVKDAEDAASPTERRKRWEWFTQVAMTRLMSAKSRVVIIMTRWHEDDLVGRIIDPHNESYNLEEARQWKMINVPAIAKEDDVLGRKPGESLWPERFSSDFLESAKRTMGRSFHSLYQGEPTPEDGDFFKKEWIVKYTADELPSNLRHYAASDHAVSTAQGSDSTVLLSVGVDEDSNIWILPDLFWRRADSDTVVEAMLDIMRRNKPLLWWSENGHISKSIGPFLRKRMQEEQVYTSIVEVNPARDKMTRAQSFQARLSMGKIRFPAFAPWINDAIDQMLKFPNTRHDDLIDALSWIGNGLNLLVSASTAKPKKDLEPKTGTMAWVKMASKWESKRKQLALLGGY